MKIKEAIEKSVKDCSTCRKIAYREEFLRSQGGMKKENTWVYDFMTYSEDFNGDSWTKNIFLKKWTPLNYTI